MPLGDSSVGGPAFLSDGAWWLDKKQQCFLEALPDISDLRADSRRQEKAFCSLAGMHPPPLKGNVAAFQGPHMGRGERVDICQKESAWISVGCLFMLDQFNFLVCKSWPFVFPYGKFLVVRKQPPLTWFWITDPTPVNSCAALTGQALLRVSLLQLRVFHSTSSMFWFFNCSIGMMTVSPM